MPTIHFQTATDDAVSIDAKTGLTLMEVAVDHDVAGIVAECGGACACATCHVYVDPAWQDKLPAVSDMEDAMLDSAMDRQAGSRLSCQIEITPELDGLVIRVAENES